MKLIVTPEVGDRISVNDYDILIVGNVLDDAVEFYLWDETYRVKFADINFYMDGSIYLDKPINVPLNESDLKGSYASFYTWKKFVEKV